MADDLAVAVVPPPEGERRSLRARLLSLRRRALSPYSWISAGAVLVALLIWHFVISEVVEPLYFPSDTATLDAIKTRGPDLLGDIWATTYRVVIGTTIGVVVGVAIGVAMSASRLFNAIAEPFIEVMRPIPAFALIPFFILWFGLGDTGKFLLIALGGVMVMIVTVYEALSHVPQVYVNAARTLGVGRRKLYTTILLPAILPEFWSGVRVATALSFGLGIAAEFMGAQRGVGYLILLANRTLDTEVMLLGVIVIGVLSYSVDRLVRIAARRTTRWAA